MKSLVDSAVVDQILCIFQRSLSKFAGKHLSQLVVPGMVRGVVPLSGP